MAGEEAAAEAAARAAAAADRYRDGRPMSRPQDTLVGALIEPVASEPIDLSPARAAVAYLSETVLRSYAQILFGRSRTVGLLLLAATAVSPALALHGITSVLLAAATARALELSDELIRSGLFGYNALLIGLGAASMLQPGATTLLLLAVAVVVSVFVTAAVHSALGATFNLPALTVPFLIVFSLLLAAAPLLGVASVPVATASMVELPLPPSVRLFVRSLGAIFFLPRVDAGLLVLLALVVCSRIGLLLAVFGFAIAQLIGLRLDASCHSMLPMVLGYNVLLTAQALGGVWFVPSRSSFLFAGVGVLVTGLLSLALQGSYVVGGVPLLILPFNLTVFLLLYAMRQRTWDRAPKSVDFLLGTPEENLSYYRTRVGRFGANYIVRLQAPFLGRWICTQAVDGDRTHQGPWRYGLDFEVADARGELHRGAGAQLEDYYCYRLPVLACADGVVAKVVDGIPDNVPGEINLEQNWGNLVLLYHGPGLYSLVCHLSPNTIEVQQGQPVRQGDRLGLCGASGRAPAPHIHFQLQATARIGAPTLYVELHDVVCEAEQQPQMFSTFVPTEGDIVRNLEPQEDMGRLLSVDYGQLLAFSVNGQQRQHYESIAADIDLYGNLLLRSKTLPAMLYYDLKPGHFTVFDTLGRRGSVLQLIQTTLSRVPLEATDELVWRDLFPLRHFLPWYKRGLHDLVSPFVQNGRVEVLYSTRRQGHRLLVEGRSVRQRRGEPLVSTLAVLADGIGIEKLELKIRRRVFHAERIN